MLKCFTRVVALLVVSTMLMIVAATNANAQTVTITTVNAGPYTPGSTIAVPLHVDYTSCIDQKNVFNLYLSDASGSFASETLIGSTNGFYATFVNGTLPASLPAGSGYKVRIKTTNTATISSPSTAFTVVAGASVTAGLNGQSVSTTYPDVFGVCNGQDGNTFPFANATKPTSASVTANFYNESTQKSEVNTDVSGGYTFTAKATNYTIIVTAVSNGTVATKAYTLINNVVSTPLESSGNNSVCLSEGQGTIVFTITLQSLLKNYPGSTYLLSFGDGSSITLTQCDVQQSNGLVSHTYTTSSCGQNSPQAKNAFLVQLQSSNPFCGAVGTAVSTSAKVFEAPYNRIGAHAQVCSGTPDTLINNSYPGQNPTTTGLNCLNSAARYTWSVDGKPVLFNATVSDKFIYTFTTTGKHVITLDLQGGTSSCNTASVSDTICVANPPQPAFSLPARACLSAPVVPKDQSVVDNTCTIGGYTWKVTGPAPVTYAGGTSNTSTQPQFVFATPGTYLVNLSINSVGCGLIPSKTDTLIVDGPPVTQLSPDAILCGSNQTLSFSTGSGPTQTTLTGSGPAAANTYTWTVTGGNYQFVNKTTANSQYPQIKFTDYATYTVTVTQQNACGTTSAKQNISFLESPTVSAGTDQHICYGTPAALQGSISGNVNSYQWIGGTGTFSNPQSLTATYTPSAAELAAGQVTLALQAITNLSAPCNTITSNVTLFINPQVKVTSANTANVCSGQALSYKITSSDPKSTFTWTASVTSGSASGYTASGNGGSINDVITASGATNAVVTYTITPTSSSLCPGLPFTLNVTVTPLPVATATAANSIICSNQPANISLSSNVTGTTYTWTSTSTGGVVGNDKQTTPTTTASINDVLSNTGTAQGTVTYTITPYNNGTCAGSPISVTVTVQPPPVPANAGPDDQLCNLTTYTLRGNSPTPGTGKWSVSSGQTGITFSDPTQPNAVVSGLVPGNTYSFVWAISSAPTCSPSTDTVIIVVKKDVVPTFTITPHNGCGPVQVTFNNTSAGIAGTSYVWDFGDGSAKSTDASPAPHTFNPSTNGRDTTYYITLNVSGNCNPHPPAIDSVTVSPVTPTAIVQPGKLTGCAPFTLTAQNYSPGTNKKYDYYLYDGTTLLTNGPITKTDKSDVVFPPLNPTSTKTYTLYMIATNNCGNTGESKHVPVTVSPANLIPQFFADNNNTKGCTPFTTTFVNNSKGGVQFQYNIYDSSSKLIDSVIAGTANVSYTFPAAPGEYYVSIKASDDCSTLPIESAKTPFFVYAVPAPAFTANTLAACKTLTVTFTNKTADAAGAPASSLAYQWDFGDGTTAGGYTPQPHPYTKPGKYTVTLTATNNASGCSNTATIANYITVNAPPDVAFSVEPDSVIKIPNYRFSFTDETTGSAPTAWLWDFGDGSSSHSQNPSHTYADTGRYTVTLTVANSTGCSESKSHQVAITGVPGQLFVPNAFMPSSASTELQTFKAKGSGIKAYHLQIFNNWGQLVWETTELDSRGEPMEGWDGTFKGAPVPQGVYIWQMSATFINGTEWKGMTYGSGTPKRTGPIHLLR